MSAWPMEPGGRVQNTLRWVGVSRRRPHQEDLTTRRLGGAKRGPVVQPGIPVVSGRRTSGLQAFRPLNRKVAGSNPARSTRTALFLLRIYVVADQWKVCFFKKMLVVSFLF